MSKLDCHKPINNDRAEDARLHLVKGQTETSNGIPNAVQKGIVYIPLQVVSWSFDRSLSETCFEFQRLEACPLTWPSADETLLSALARHSEGHSKTLESNHCRLQHCS